MNDIAEECSVKTDRYIDVHPISSIVMLNGDLPVRVLSIQITDGYHVKYEVAWFNDGVRNTAWVHGFELSPHEETRYLVPLIFKEKMV